METNRDGAEISGVGMNVTMAVMISAVKPATSSRLMTQVCPLCHT